MREHAVVFSAEDGWYYVMNDRAFGPYTTQVMAEDAFEAHFQALHCPTCED